MQMRCAENASYTSWPCGQEILDYLQPWRNMDATGSMQLPHPALVVPEMLASGNGDQDKQNCLQMMLWLQNYFGKRGLAFKGLDHSSQDIVNIVNSVPDCHSSS